MVTLGFRRMEEGTVRSDIGPGRMYQGAKRIPRAVRLFDRRRPLERHFFYSSLIEGGLDRFRCAVIVVNTSGIEDRGEKA